MNETCGASAPLIPPIYTFDLQLKNRKTYAILRHVAGSISLIASSILVWSVLRSHIRLSSTFNRLLFGLCVADIMSSCAYMLSTVMIPKEVDYFYWNARGNMLTCNLQGFLSVMGCSASLYNCSICIYYLAIVKYNKSDKFIRDKIEPWLHGVSILFPLAGAIIGVTTKAMNPWGSHCTLRRYNPPHCEDCEYGQIRDEAKFNIPCGSGKHATLLFDVFIRSIIIVSPIIITATLYLMHQAVAKNARNMRRRYGAGTLQTSTEGQSSKWNLLKLCQESPCRRNRRLGINGRRSSQDESMRQIFYRNIAYSLGWLLTYVFFLSHRIINLRGYKIPIYIFFLDGFFLPLQGLFNFIIYTYPKVIKSKNKDNTSWLQAFVKVVMSRGRKREESRRQTPLNDFRSSSGPTRRSSLFQSIKVQARRLSAVVSHLVPSSSSKSTINSNISRMLDGDVKLDETDTAAICSNRDLELEGKVPHIHTAKFSLRLGDMHHYSTSGRLLSNGSIEIDAGGGRDADADHSKDSEQHILNVETICERSNAEELTESSIINKDASLRSVRFEDRTSMGKCK